jgi:hypothetical protein
MSSADGSITTNPAAKRFILSAIFVVHEGFQRFDSVGHPLRINGS